MTQSVTHDGRVGDRSGAWEEGASREGAAREGASREGAPRDGQRISVLRQDRWVVVSLTGELDRLNADRMRAEAVATVSEGVRHPWLALDLRRLTFCDLAGLNAIVGIWRAVTRVGGRLVLLSPQRRCRTLLGRTRLLSVLEVYDRLPASRDQPWFGHFNEQHYPAHP
jgi:anti-sigma B factor antagonist